jgi:hypothetical protein
MFISKIGQTVFFWPTRCMDLDPDAVPHEGQLGGLRADEESEQAYIKGWGWYDLADVFSSQREAYDAAAQCIVLHVTEKVEIAKRLKLKTLDLPEMPEELLVARKAA